MQQIMNGIGPISKPTLNKGDDGVRRVARVETSSRSPVEPEFLPPSLPLVLIGHRPASEAVDIADGDCCQIDSDFPRQLSLRNHATPRVNADARNPSIYSVGNHSRFHDIHSRGSVEDDALTVVTGHEYIKHLQPIT